MLTLLSEIHFWSSHDDICIKDSDYGAYKYYDKKDSNLLADNTLSKKAYSEKRDYLWHLPNKRPTKLKDKLKELEEQIAQNNIVYCKWADNSILQIMLCTGIIINICINVYTGDIQKISFDKYLVGKLLSECISDVLITRSHLLCTYNDNRISVVHFTKQTPGVNGTVDKLSRLEPRQQTAELAGPTGRRLERRMSCSAGGDRLLVWWRCTRDEVYPWSPLVKDQDRANIHIYSLIGLKLELLCYRRTEFDPVDVTFDPTRHNIIHCVEQKVSRKGVVTVETSTYEIVKNKLQQQLLTSIPLQTHVCCHAFSPDNQKLFLGCIDGSVVLFDQGRGVTHLVKAAFIPSIASWHLDGAVILVANERCQIQCFDVSLACIKSQVMSEDITPSNILDLASYFKNQPTLLQMSWNKRPAGISTNGRYLPTDALLLLMFEHGTLAALRLIGGGGSVDAPGLAPDALVSSYVHAGHVDRAIAVLLGLDWDVNGAACLIALQCVLGYLFRKRLTPQTEAQIQRALGSFYAPLRPISGDIHAEFGEQVWDLTRKFFHILVRYRLYEKAFCLAIDVNDYDLFMDLYYSALFINDEEMASAALGRAKDLINRSGSNSEHSVCSRSSCSQCSDNESNHSDQNEWVNACAEATASAVPPLPVPGAYRSSNPSHAPPSVPAYATPPLPTVPNKPQPIQNIPPFPTVRKLSAQPMVRPLAHGKFFTTSQSPLLSTRFETAPSIVKPPSLTLTSTARHVENTSGILKPKFTSYEPSAFQSLRLRTPVIEKPAAFTPTFTAARQYQVHAPIFSTTPVPAPREIVHRTISLSIPPAPSLVASSAAMHMPSVRSQPPLKVSVPLQSGSGGAVPQASTKNSGEKNVKFSDTVTAFIVPEISRSDKSQVKDKMRRPNLPNYMTDPKQELADSLPLCHPNDDYLKDFTPISNNSEDDESGTKIKVVHFGMV